MGEATPSSRFRAFQEGCEKVGPVEGQRYNEVRPLPDSEIPVVESYVE